MNKDTDSFKPYFGSKKEGQGFADKRKRKAAYEYLKLLKKEKRQQGGQSHSKHHPLPFLHAPESSPGKGKRIHAFSVAERIARKKQEEKERHKQEVERIKSEKTAALSSYKEKKKRQHMKLCKKTSKGQPVMKYQMELLLEKIQKQKSGSR
ncbi:hypothetical protein Btru_009822 [Bulinus truncatus]|nr:hypothetical protein Btru_009822 [Bulinus truncatus]